MPQAAAEMPAENPVPRMRFNCIEFIIPHHAFHISAIADAALLVAGIG